MDKKAKFTLSSSMHSVFLPGFILIENLLVVWHKEPGTRYNYNQDEKVILFYKPKEICIPQWKILL